VQRVRDEHVHFAHSSVRQARLPNRVFNINFEHCLLCGGELKIIAAIEGAAVIFRILMHLGLSARPPLG
jgi:hypothetical protein